MQANRKVGVLLLWLFPLLAQLAADEPSPDTRLNLNTATAEQLETLPHVGPAFAHAIVEMRTRNGGFRCVEELRALPRLPEKHYVSLAPLLKVKDGRNDCASLEAQRRSGQPLRATGSQ